MMRFLIDTSVFLYARGREHRYREPCRGLVEHAERGLLNGEASVELVQEYAHVLRRKGLPPNKVREDSQDLMKLVLLHDFEEPDLRLALNLVADFEGIGMRDGVHAATALRRGIRLIVATDRGFDQIDGLERVDPIGAVKRLTG